MYLNRALSPLLLAAMSLLLTAAGAPAEDTVATHPPGTRTGVASVDGFLDLFEADDVDGLAARVVYRRLPCVAEGTVSPHPTCLPGEQPGTIVEVAWFEGWLRRAEVPSDLEGLAASDRALFGVKSGTRIAGGTIARFSIFLAGPAPNTSAYILYLTREGGIAGGFYAKHSAVCEAWIGPGFASPPQILPPVERCPGPPPPPYKLRTVRILGGPADEAALGMAADDDGNLAIVWSAAAPKGSRIVVQRRSADGRLASRMRVPGAAGSRAAVAVDGSTTFVATESESGGDTDIRVVALGPSSQVLWTRDIGGSGDERLTAMLAGASNGLVVLGTSNSPSVGDEDSAGATDLLLARIDRDDGDVVWTRLLGGTPNETAIDLSSGPSGKTYVVGESRSTSIDGGKVAHESGMFVARFATDGARDWIGFPDPELVLDQLGKATAIGAYDGGAYVAGLSAGDSPRSGAGRVVQFTEEGANHYWNNADGIITDFSVQTDTGLGVAGYKNRNWPKSHPSAGGTDMFFSVLGPETGQGDWWERFGGAGDDRAVAIVALPGGSFAILGSTDSREIRGQRNRGGGSVVLAIYSPTSAQ